MSNQQNEWNGCHEIPHEQQGSSLTTGDHVIANIVIIAVMIGVIFCVRACTQKEDIAAPETSSSTVNNATRLLIESANTPSFQTLVATLPLATRNEDGIVIAFDYATANLAVTKVQGSDGELIIVMGCHNDDFEALQKRFETGSLTGRNGRNEFEFKFSPIIDTEDDQTIADFDGEILTMKHSSIRCLVPQAIPVLIYNQDGELIFKGLMWDETGNFPTIPSQAEGPSYISA